MAGCGTVTYSVKRDLVQCQKRPNNLDRRSGGREGWMWDSHWHMYPPPRMTHVSSSSQEWWSWRLDVGQSLTHVSSSSYDTCILLLAGVVVVKAGCGTVTCRWLSPSFGTVRTPVRSFSWRVRHPSILIRATTRRRTRFLCFLFSSALLQKGAPVDPKVYEKNVFCIEML